MTFLSLACSSFFLYWIFFCLFQGSNSQWVNERDRSIFHVALNLHIFITHCYLEWCTVHKYRFMVCMDQFQINGFNIFLTCMYLLWLDLSLSLSIHRLSFISLWSKKFTGSYLVLYENGYPFQIWNFVVLCQYEFCLDTAAMYRNNFFFFTVFFLLIHKTLTKKP